MDYFDEYTVILQTGMPLHDCEQIWEKQSYFNPLYRIIFGHVIISSDIPLSDMHMFPRN